MRARTNRKIAVNEDEELKNDSITRPMVSPGEGEPSWVTALRVCFHHYVASHPQRFTVTEQQGNRRRIETVSVNKKERD